MHPFLNRIANILFDKNDTDKQVKTYPPCQWKVCTRICLDLKIFLTYILFKNIIYRIVYKKSYGLIGTI